jgi:hypothetical protein
LGLFDMFGWKLVSRTLRSWQNLLGGYMKSSLLYLFSLLMLVSPCYSSSQTITHCSSIQWPMINDILVKGCMAFCTSDNGMVTWNVANPYSPICINHLNLQDISRGIDISGDYIFIACQTFGLQIINIADPIMPVLAGEYDTPGFAWDVFISGDYAYVADGRYGLQIINVRDPARPRLIGNYPDNAYSVFVSGDYAYIANWGSGLLLVDITVPNNPTLAGSFSSLPNPEDLYVAGNYSYLADYGSGLHIFELANPLRKIARGYYSQSRHPLAVFVSGNYAYVADDSSGLHIVNIRDPFNPVFIDGYGAVDNARAINVSGDYIYLADELSLQILRFTPPIIMEDTNLLKEFSLSQNCPNPFYTQTTIRYYLPRQSKVTIDIFDILGRKIETLTVGIMAAGEHRAIWNANINSSGIYFFRIKTDDKVETKKMLLLK